MCTTELTRWMRASSVEPWVCLCPHSITRACSHVHIIVDKMDESVTCRTMGTSVHIIVDKMDKIVTCRTMGTSVPTQHNKGLLQGTGWSTGGTLHISHWLCCRSQIDCSTCCTSSAHSAQHLQLLFWLACGDATV